MNIKLLVVVVGLVFALLVSIISIQSLPSTALNDTSPDVYVGIDVAYDNQTITALIDEVSSYTNLFIVGCTSITENQSRLDSICQYLYDKGMSFIIYQNVPLSYQSFQYPTNQTRPLNETNSPYPSSSNLTGSQRQSYNFTQLFNANTASNWTQTAKDRWGTHFLGIY